MKIKFISQLKILRVNKPDSYTVKFRLVIHLHSIRFGDFWQVVVLKLLLLFNQFYSFVKRTGI